MSRLPHPPGEDRDVPRFFIQAVARGLAMLEVFGEEHPDLSLTELARAMGTNTPTARRFVQTLLQLGYLEALPGKRYRLGTRTLELGRRYLASISLTDRARPYLEELAAATGETTNLAVREGRDVVYVVRVEAAPRILSVNLRVGSRLPLHATSLGKALVSAMTDEKLLDIMGQPPWPALTPHTVRSPQALRPHLQHVTDHGYAVSDQELELGLRSIAAPVYDAERRLVAAINVSTSVAQVSREQLTGPFATALVRTAQQLSVALGCPEVTA